MKYDTPEGLRVLPGVLLLFCPIFTLALGALLGHFPYMNFPYSFGVVVLNVIGFFVPMICYFLTSYLHTKLSRPLAFDILFVIALIFGVLNAYYIGYNWDVGMQIYDHFFIYAVSSLSIATHLMVSFFIKLYKKNLPHSNYWKAHALFWSWFFCLAFPFVIQEPLII